MRTLCVLMLVAVPLAARADSSDASSKLLVDRVAAVVNDAVILTSELDLRLSPVRAEVMQITDRHERDRRLAKLATQLLDEMINDELVVQAAREAKITVEASEVQEAVDYIKRQNKLDDAQLAAAMKAQGITTSTLRNDLVRQRAVSQLVSPKVQVTEEDLRAHYDQMQRRSSTVSAVSLSQIVFELPDHPTEQQLTAARGKAQRALDRIKAGEEFAKVASEVSEDPSTKPTGGMLGWIEPSTLSATWEPVVFGMDKGEVRGPITGPKGLHLLFANEVKRTQLKPFADMKDELSQDLRRRALGKLTQSWIEELRKKAYIDIKLK